MKVVIGHSEDVDSDAAIGEVLQICEASLDGVIPQAGLLYVAIDHEFQLILDKIMSRYPDLELVGCSTDSEVSSTLGFAEDSVVLMLFESEKVGFGAGVGLGVGKNPEEAARRAVSQASASLADPIRLCITNPAGLGTDMGAILDALSDTLGIDVTICGGLAADQARFRTTYQFYRNEVYQDAVPVLLFSGALLVSTGVQSGWQPIGGKNKITKAEGTIVYTINDKPAKEFWMEFFGTLEFNEYLHAMTVFPGDTFEDDEEETGAFPADGSSGFGEFYLSTPFTFLEDGSMVVQNPLPEGACMRIADATRAQIVAGAEISITNASDGYPGAKPDAALVFSCAGRRVALGTRVTEEARLLREHLGEDLPTIGFYSYGEYCPLPGSPKPQSHGCTFVTVLLGEA